MKRLVRKAEGFWVGPGQVSQDALGFIKENLNGQVYVEGGTDNSSSYTFMTAKYSMPFGYLEQKYGKLNAAQVANALASYYDYFKSFLLNKMMQENPTEARNLTLTSVDMGVSLDGMQLYLNGEAGTNNQFVPHGEYVDEYHW